MWLAAAAGDQPEGSYALLNIVFIFAGVVVTVAGGVITALINKSAKAAQQPQPQPVVPEPPDPGAELRTLVRTLQERADNCDDTTDIMDRRLERHELYIELVAQRLKVDLPRLHRRDPL